MTPIVLPTQDGALYLSVHVPQGLEHTQGWILHLPAFAEEMNRSRCMVSHQARRLAELGFSVVIPDLYGTGDSEGDFAQADWSTWRRNALAVLDWMESTGAGSVCLWGLRLGALLALDVACATSLRVRQLVLWQPVLSGSVYVQQHLRQFALSPLSDSTGESVATIKERLAAGEAVELGGYKLSAGLVEDITRLDAKTLAVPLDAKLTWLDVSIHGSPKLQSASAEFLELVTAMPQEVERRVVQGSSFWAAQETMLVPSLVEETVDAVTESPDSSDVCPDFKNLSPAPKEHAVKPVVFSCVDDELSGILHEGGAAAELAVVFLVGGPQYRIGAHRQFVHLARSFAAAGIPAFRFDFRGMGDSTGVSPGFDGTQQDIDSAICALQQELPDVRHVVLWGLCDGATAAALYAGSDPRVRAIILANPWLHTEAGHARTYLKHYYPRRLASGDFWRQLFTGRLDIANSLTSFFRAWKLSAAGGGSRSSDSLTERVCSGLSVFHSPVFLLLSENDLTAAEFSDVVDHHEALKAKLADTQVSRAVVEDADHTFSREAWKEQVSTLSVDWVKSLDTSEVA